jgi:hypothetical protein
MSVLFTLTKSVPYLRYQPIRFIYLIQAASGLLNIVKKTSAIFTSLMKRAPCLHYERRSNQRRKFQMHKINLPSVVNSSVLCEFNMYFGEFHEWLRDCQFLMMKSDF